MHILMIHADISADTDVDADGIHITVCASHSNLFVGYMHSHIFSKTQGYFLPNFGPKIYQSDV